MILSTKSFLYVDILKQFKKEERKLKNSIKRKQKESAKKLSIKRENWAIQNLKPGDFIKIVGTGPSAVRVVDKIQSDNVLCKMLVINEFGNLLIEGLRYSLTDKVTSVMFHRIRKTVSFMIV